MWAPDTNKLHQLINVMQNPVARRDSHIKRKETLVVLPGVRIADVSRTSPMLSLFISPVAIFAFTTGEVIEDKFFLRPFFDWNATTTKLLGNFQKDLPKGNRSQRAL